MILTKELQILGDIITTDCLLATRDKILKVSYWETSNTRKKLQGYMGLITYLS